LNGALITLLLLRKKKSNHAFLILNLAITGNLNKSRLISLEPLLCNKIKNTIYQTVGPVPKLNKKKS
jgi:hypothetical protein